MASKICINCGLTTDSQGRLIVNTGTATWPYDCTYTHGVPVVCGADGVVRSGMPEKFAITFIDSHSYGDGQVTSATFGSPTVGGGNKTFGPDITRTIVNPSACLPMTLRIRYGVKHCVFAKIGSGNSSVLYGTTLNLTGSVVSGPNDAHQQWRHDGSVNHVAYDTMNSTNTIAVVLPAGGTTTLALTPYINVTSYNGNTTLTNLQTVLDVHGFN